MYFLDVMEDEETLYAFGEPGWILDNGWTHTSDADDGCVYKLPKSRWAEFGLDSDFDVWELEKNIDGWEKVFAPGDDLSNTKYEQLVGQMDEKSEDERKRRAIRTWLTAHCPIIQNGFYGGHDAPNADAAEYMRGEAPDMRHLRILGKYLERYDVFDGSEIRGYSFRGGQDLDEAEKCYREAARLGSDKAARALDKIKGRDVEIPREAILKYVPPADGEGAIAVAYLCAPDRLSPSAPCLAFIPIKDKLDLSKDKVTVFMRAEQDYKLTGPSLLSETETMMKDGWGTLYGGTRQLGLHIMDFFEHDTYLVNDAIKKCKAHSNDAVEFEFPLKCCLETVTDPEWGELRRCSVLVMESHATRRTRYELLIPEKFATENGRSVKFKVPADARIAGGYWGADAKLLAKNYPVNDKRGK